jgi:hypothetical protein
MRAVTMLTLWSFSAGAQDSPEARAHHQLVYHADEGLVYLLGGSTRTGDAYHYFDDVWRWDGTAWIRDGSLPFPRSSHRVVHHADRGSILLFGGGAEGEFASDGTIWEWREGDWSAVAPAPGEGRAEPGMCYDRRRRRVVVFGGWNSARERVGDTWEWSGRAAPFVDGRRPASRAGHAFLYDPKSRRCLLFGGRDDEGFRSDTWLWDGATWERVSVTGPSPRWFFGAATDAANQRVVIFGGNGPTGDLGDTWVWDGTEWTLLTTDGPTARGMAKLAFDGHGVLLFGGRTVRPGGFTDHGDTWQLRDRRWTRKR